MSSRKPLAHRKPGCGRIVNASGPRDFRLVNTDVADLYERVPVGTKVIIRQKPEL